MTGQRIAYKRVSTLQQSTVRQLDGVAVDRVFEDKASGKDMARPQLQAALAFCREGDILVVSSMDRLARSLADLLSLVKGLTARGVAVQFVKESLTFTGDDAPIACLLLSMLGAVAQFERDLILERIRDGVQLARKAGKYKGRKRSISEARIAELRQRVASGQTSKTALAKEFGISRETLYSYLRGDTAKSSVSVERSAHPTLI